MEGLTFIWSRQRDFRLRRINFSSLLRILNLINKKTFSIGEGLIFIWSRQRDSNPRPRDYKSRALAN